MLTNEQCNRRDAEEDAEKMHVLGAFLCASAVALFPLRQSRFRFRVLVDHVGPAELFCGLPTSPTQTIAKVVTRWSSTTYSDGIVAQEEIRQDVEESASRM